MPGGQNFGALLNRDRPPRFDATGTPASRSAIFLEEHARLTWNGNCLTRVRTSLPRTMLNSPEPAPRPGDRSAGGLRLCELLASARQQRGVTLQHIAHETKIPLRHLAALEREDLSAVPGGLYRRAEVRAFARAVGVDDRVALDCLERLEAPPPVAAPAPPPPARPRRSTRARLELVIGLGIVAAVVFGRILWERRAMLNPEGRPAVVDLTGGRAVAAEGAIRNGARPGASAQDEAFPQADVPLPLPADVVAAPADTGRATDRNAPAAAHERVASSGTTSPEPAVTGAELSIVTDPPGGRVTVNGIGWGSTPVTIRHLPPGRKRIRVTLDGYDSVERVVQADAGRSSRVTIPLRQP